MVQLRTMILYRKQNQEKNLDLGNFDYVFKGNQKANINKKNQNNNMLNKFAIFVVSCEKIFICTLKP